jgi:hypothetical protein
MLHPDLMQELHACECARFQIYENDFELHLVQQAKRVFRRLCDVHLPAVRQLRE